ncbi:MAG: AlpA family phage regulatory protein [Gammaproteobacteria bacterium]|nr:AlpA family phage regulatory protein [Gammaproteobacteria bacterium]
MRLKEIMVLTGLSRSTIYRYMDKGLFPKNVCLGERSVAWKGTEVSAWMSRLA